MAEIIAVNTMTLASDIEALNSQLNKAKNDVQKMYVAIQTLNTMWTGPANIVYVAKFLSDKAKMEEMCQTIQKIIDCCSYAKSEYEACERTVNSIVNSISV